MSKAPQSDQDLAIPGFHSALIETQYLPPIETFARIIGFKRLVIERREHWVKRSYRNRAMVASPGGPIRLSIPLQRSKGIPAGYQGEDVRSDRRITGEVEIAYEENWRKDHWATFEAGYRRSPYFEYYEDSLEPFYQKGYDRLIDFNTDLLRFFLEILEIDIEISFTDRWDRHPSIGVADFRDAIQPKGNGRPDPFYTAPEYNQVFGDRHGFLPGLSIADMIFNLGPRSGPLIRKAIAR